MFQGNRRKPSVFSWAEIGGISLLPLFPMGKKSQSTDDLFKLDKRWHDVPIIREITNSNDRKLISLERAAGEIGFLPCPEMSVLRIYRGRSVAAMGASPGVS